MIEDMLLEGCPFEDKLLDLKNLEIGKVYLHLMMESLNLQDYAL